MLVLHVALLMYSGHPAPDVCAIFDAGSANLNYKMGRGKKSGMLFAAFFATAAKHGFKEGSTIL